MKITNKEYYIMVSSEIWKHIHAYEVGVLLPELNCFFEEYSKINSEFDPSEAQSIDAEGRYTNHPSLTSYFRKTRLLQETKKKDLHNNFISEKLKETGDFMYRSRSSLGENKITDKVLPVKRNLFQKILKDCDEENPRPWDCKFLVEKMFALSDYQNIALFESFSVEGGELISLIDYLHSMCLYNEKVLVSGYLPHTDYCEWSVDPRYQQIGERLISEINNLIGSRIEEPSIYNWNNYKINYEDMLCYLGKVENTGEKYYWNWSDNKLTDFYTKDSYSLVSENLRRDKSHYSLLK